MRVAVIFCALLLWPMLAMADVAQLVGRLNIGRGGFCTASLIDSQTILTAGHCLQSPDGTDRPLAPMRFFLALGDDGAVAARHITQIALPAAFFQMGAARLNNDIALARLDAPLDVSALAHLHIGPLPAWSAQVKILRYDRMNSNHIAQQNCKVAAREGQAALLSCTVDSGASGAPVFVMDEAELYLAAVVSRKISAPERGTLAIAAQDAIAQLRRQLR